MQIFNLLIANAKDYKRKLDNYEIQIDDYKREIDYLNKNNEHFHKELLKEYGIENDLKEQLQHKENLYKIKKLVKNNNEILTKLEIWLKSPNMFKSGEDYKNYTEAYIKLKQNSIDLIEWKGDNYEN